MVTKPFLTANMGQLYCIYITHKCNSCKINFFKVQYVINTNKAFQIMGGICPWGICPGGNCPGGNCPGGKCTGGKCPGGYMTRGKCPVGTCPGFFCSVTGEDTYPPEYYVQG